MRRRRKSKKTSLKRKRLQLRAMHKKRPRKLKRRTPEPLMTQLRRLKLL